MRKKIFMIAGLAGAVTLTGLAGAAYAADGTTPPAPKPGQVFVTSCSGKTITGKPGDPRTFSFKTGPEIKGKPGQVVTIPVPGLKAQKAFKDGKGVEIQKFDGKGIPPGAIKIENKGLKGLKALPGLPGLPGKDVKCVFAPKDAAQLPAPVPPQ